MHKTIKEVLIAARKRIEKPENWTKQTSARDHTGTPVDPASPTAVCWCALGALGAETRMADGDWWTKDDELRCRAVDTLRMAAVNQGNEDGFVSKSNDEGSHEGILKLYDQAIKLAEEQESK